MDLDSLLAQLHPPQDGAGDGERFAALPIPGLEAHRIARGRDLQPALLISVRDDPSDRRVSPPIQLEHISVQHGVSCRLHEPSGPVLEAPFTVVRLIEGDAALRAHFLKVLVPLLLELGSKPSQIQIHHAVDGLIDLFRALSRPPRKSAQGLWGELFLIASAGDTATLMDSWHAEPADRYDFSRGPERIEVKSAATRTRKHRFSLDQLRPLSGTRVLIASVLVESAGAGISLGELVHRVHMRLGSAAEHRRRLDHVVAQTLGESLTRSLELRFDLELATDSLAFYDAHMVPSIGGAIPPGVSEVQWVADLTGVDPLERSSIVPNGELFRGLFPLRSAT